VNNFENTPTSGARRHDRVRVVLHRGVRWHVWEGTARHGRDMVPHLFYASDAAVRRVPGFPEAWYELSDAALMALGD